MNNCQQPKIQPLPPPLRGSDLNTFAYRTVTERLPHIARRVIEENEFPPEVVAAMEGLIAEIPYYPLRPLDDPQAPDFQDWIEYLRPVFGRNWLEVSWFFAEMYFFRRILAATGYFKPGPLQGVDPYLPEKQASLDEATPAIQAASERLEQWSQAGGWDPEAFSNLVHASLWGNQADLSLWTTGNQPEHASAQQAQAHLLIDNTPLVITLIEQAGNLSRVDLLADNSGFELVNDLALVDYLLTSQAAQTVRIHLKPFPTYVSDATPSDLQRTVNYLAHNQNKAMAAFGHRLQTALQEDRLQTTNHLFWTSPLPGWDMPSNLLQELSQADLLISKGDAHYRRWLGDLHWPVDTLLGDIVCYTPAPLLLLRTLKSEIVVGLTEDLADRTFHQDPNWKTDGLWSLIQFWMNPE